MKKRMLRLIALILVLVLSLSGCAGTELGKAMDRFFTMLQVGMTVPFEKMEYVRPEMEPFRELLQETVDQIPEATDADALMESVFELYEYYYDFFTNYYLADIRYCQDVTDIYWSDEYGWCMENSAEVSAGMDQLLYALADCELREDLEAEEYFGEGFFDLYEGDSLWDETFTALMDQENALVDQYYELNALAGSDVYSEAYYTGYGLQIEEVFAQLIQVRQQIAEYAGYESYPAFAYEFYFYRDYTPEQALSYVQQIRTELVPLYLELDGSAWAPLYESCSEEETFDYVRQCAEAVGGVALDAFKLMQTANLYDITYSENKYASSFEVFLMSYYAPFIFMCPDGNSGDKLTFVHEFGHFCNDYAVCGTVVGVDVAEVFSQGMEYLSLCYCENTEELARMKMADSLCTFVEQSAYASFELQAYLLEDVTVENVRAVFAQVCEDYGLSQWSVDSRSYTVVPHFFISPMYVISYVVSNDLAMQIYQQELAQEGAGLKLWEDGLYSMQTGLLGFAEETGLGSPFAEGRVIELKTTFEEKLK